MRERTKQEEFEESKDLIKDANTAAERLEAATKKYQDLVERQEAIAARITLGGRSDAGRQEEPPKVETPAEYKERIMRGTREAAKNT